MNRPPLPLLSPAELERYSRQIGRGVLSQEGQRRLKAAAVLVTRAGGLGGPAALALAMSGVGRIIVSHGGELESPDLNRQLLGCEAGVSRPRAAQFAAQLRAMNQWLEVEVIDHEPSDLEAVELARRVDLIMSCPADFEHRLRLNWAAYQAEVPVIDAAQWGMTGSLIVSDGRSTPCLACAYPDRPPFEEKFPVVGAIAGAMGNLAALEAIKILSGTGRPAWGELLIIDGFWGQVRRVKLTHRGACPICGPQPPATGEKSTSSSPSSSVRC